MNYLDLFSGIGGFHEGLLQSGLSFNWCGFSEIDKYAKQVYKKHFPESEDLEDVRTINPDRLPKINLVTFGFPCQDVSIAGKRGGLSASRSGLFYEAMRIIRACRPDYFIFENVKGLFSSNEGRDWIAVLREIADSGYDGQWQLLNTRWFLPQNRERIYFIGHIRGECRPEIFPIGEGNGISGKKESRQQEEGARVSSTIDSRYGALRNAGETCLIFIGGIMGDKNKMWLEDGKDNSRNFPQAQRVYSPEGSSCQLTAQGGGWGAKTGLYEICDRIRRLTPLECERLQGFSDDWTKGISDTQRYKCLGNAVSVPIVTVVGKRLLRQFQINRTELSA